MSLFTDKNKTKIVLVTERNWTIFFDSIRRIFSDTEVFNIEEKRRLKWIMYGKTV